MKMVSMQNADLTGTDFSSANLCQAQMEGVSAENSIFKGADLTYADFSHAKIKNSNFSYANLFMTNMHETEDENTRWKNSKKSLARGTDKARLKSEQWGKQ